MADKTEHQRSDHGGSPATEKRKSIDGTLDQPVLENEPATKKQKLPVRGKNAVYSSHKSVSIEIPLSRLPKETRVIEEIGDSQDEGDVSGDEEIFKTPIAERKHIVFDDDDHDEFVTPLEKPAKEWLESSAAPPTQPGPGSENPVGEEEEDSDDDAPPEAVSSRQAAAQSTGHAQAAAQAAEEQTAAKRRKRQERDALFKKQAEARKRTSELAAQDGRSGSVDDLDQAAGEGLRPEVQRKRKLEIPDVLPLELLESDDEDDEETGKTELATARQAKKVRFDNGERRSSRGDRPPRDRRVGSTVYRVMTDKTDGKLAPKAGKQSKNRREVMLVRKRAPKRRGGFFVKG